MKAILYCVLLLIGFVNATLAQTSFINVYKHDVSGATANAAVQTSDGGYAVTGRVSGDPTAYIDAFLMKTDASGTMQWFRSYGTGGIFNVEDTGYEVQQTPDGGFVVVGESLGSAYNQLFVIRTNSLGDTLWTRRFTYAPGIGKGFSIRQTSDGGFIVAGTGSTPAGAPIDATLLKLDANGNKEWCNLFGTATNDHGKAVRQTTDNGYIVVVYANATANGDVMLVKTDANGDTAWTRTFSGPLIDVPEDVIQTSDGGYLVTGHTNSFGITDEKFLLKVNGDGDFQWAKTYGNGWMNSVMETANGYAFGGLGISSNGFLTGTDFNGNLLWAAAYGGLTYVNTYKFSTTSDGGFVSAGNFNNGTLAGMSLLKAEANGKVPCHYTDVTSSTPDSSVAFTVTKGCRFASASPTLSFTTVVDIYADPNQNSVQCFATAVTEVSFENQLIVFPVPASDRVTVELQQPTIANSVLTVNDMTGKQLLSFALQPGLSRLTINLEELANGAYTLTIASSEQRLVKKISVLR